VWRQVLWPVPVGAVWRQVPSPVPVRAGLLADAEPAARAFSVPPA